MQWRRAGACFIRQDLPRNGDQMAFGVHALKVIDVKVELRLFKGLRLVGTPDEFLMGKSPTGFFIFSKLAFAGLVPRQS